MVLKYQVARFVFSSTAAVYGEPRRMPITEDDPLDPTNAYGESKLIVERMVSWFTKPTDCAMPACVILMPLERSLPSAAKRTTRRPISSRWFSSGAWAAALDRNLRDRLSDQRWNLRP